MSPIQLGSIEHVESSKWNMVLKMNMKLKCYLLWRINNSKKVEKLRRQKEHAQARHITQQKTANPNNMKLPE